ncbi:MAG: hypothetical protein ACTSUS_03070 [Candidatus Freyarchaeota archaeon]
MEAAKVPYAPIEEEIDQLIAGSGKKLSVFLQLLKETGMRCAEAIRLEWTLEPTLLGLKQIEAAFQGSYPSLLLGWLPC